MSIDDLVKTVMEELHTIVRTETVVGEPIEVGPATLLIPVCKVSFGFGAGGSRSTEAKGGGGTGGGASVEPIAFVVVKDGKPQLLSFRERRVSLGKVMELVPDILEKMRDFKAKKEEKGKQSTAQQQKKQP